MLDINIENNVQSLEIYALKNNLIQVLMNLLSNSEDALKNKKGKRDISIISDLKNDLLVLKIIDNGGGIDKDIIDTIFDKHVTNKSDGTGIGLYMSKKLVQERLYGEIKSYNSNDGACFEISFPIK